MTWYENVYNVAQKIPILKEVSDVGFSLGKFAGDITQPQRLVQPAIDNAKAQIKNVKNLIPTTLPTGEKVFKPLNEVFPTEPKKAVVNISEGAKKYLYPEKSLQKYILETTGKELPAVEKVIKRDTTIPTTSATVTPTITDILNYTIPFPTTTTTNLKEAISTASDTTTKIITTTTSELRERIKEVSGEGITQPTKTDLGIYAMLLLGFAGIYLITKK